MRLKHFLFLLLVTIATSGHSQYDVNYDPSKQRTTNLQYFKPAEQTLFVGDCIPFYHNNTYYLYWLIDSAHHTALNTLGGHQWVLSTSTDLKSWKHYPVVIGIDDDWEKSICTGSIVYKDQKFYAFYATRLLKEGKVYEQLSYAISDDGIHFKKQKPNPFYTSAPGYSARDFRDPKVFLDAGRFHLLISSKEEKSAIKGADGCLVHLSSADLKTWKVEEPVLTNQPSVPECPDYFTWNGWHYLIYSDNSRTYYLQSRSFNGPWQQPRTQALKEDWSNVVKTAAFKNNRRIAAGWISSRKDNHDAGGEIFGGNIVFRELFQQPDGSLTSGFPAEMLPQSLRSVQPKPSFNGADVSRQANGYKLQSATGIASMALSDIPVNSRVRLTLNFTGRNESFGLYARSDSSGAGGYQLELSALDQFVTLSGTSITGVERLDKKVTLDLVMQDDIMDVCINGKRCVVNRTIDHKGSNLVLYVKHGSMTVSDLRIDEIASLNP